MLPQTFAPTGRRAKMAIVPPVSLGVPMDPSMKLPDAAQRIADLLEAMGHDRPVVMLPETGKTSAEAAARLGCRIAEIAKSIVFRRLSDDAPVMVIASGANRVDEHKIAALTGAVGKADARFVKERTGFAIGGVCPIGHPGKTCILVDQDLLPMEVIWAAAGHPHAVFSLTPTQLLAMTGAVAADVALRSQPG
jgi:prolyl-tRNA editing enzyme YbaK/EbsC (Cys-tRNA(Pro) deacylase)